MNRTHLFENFHKLDVENRLKKLMEHCGLSTEEAQTLSGFRPFSLDIAEHLIENVVGVFPIPLGVATYFNIDGKDRVIPMAVEETSIIAAASATAKWVRREGSITTYTKGNLIIGQVQIPNVQNVNYARKTLLENREELIQIANAAVPGLVNRGGGVRDISVRELDRYDSQGKMLVLHILCDPCDAMGANLINQVCEALKPHIERLTDERVGL